MKNIMNIVDFCHHLLWLLFNFVIAFRAVHVEHGEVVEGIVRIVL